MKYAKLDLESLPPKESPRRIIRFFSFKSCTVSKHFSSKAPFFENECIIGSENL